METSGSKLQCSRVLLKKIRRHLPTTPLGAPFSQYFGEMLLKAELWWAILLTPEF